MAHPYFRQLTVVISLLSIVTTTSSAAPRQTTMDTDTCPGKTTDDSLYSLLPTSRFNPKYSSSLPVDDTSRTQLDARKQSRLKGSTISEEYGNTPEPPTNDLIAHSSFDRPREIPYRFLAKRQDWLERLIMYNSTVILFLAFNAFVPTFPQQVDRLVKQYAEIARKAAHEWSTLTPVGTLKIKLGVTTLRLEAHGKQGNETIPWGFVEELAYRMGRAARAGFDGFFEAVGLGVWFGAPVAYAVFLARFVGPRQDRLIPNLIGY